MIAGEARRKFARLWLACAFALLAACGFARAAAEKPRVALVVGAGKYQHVAALPNTLNDAREVAAALGKVGFDVDLVADPDKATLDAAIRRFGERASGADAALFYYAGHALELDGRNWIVPVSANIRAARDLPYETSDIDTLMSQLEGAARLAIVVLDSCRDNPFRQQLSTGRGVAGSPGLAEIRAATGALIEYATAPGNVAADGQGPHSPFTEALLKHLDTPGLEVRQLFGAVRRDVRSATGNRQIPWESSAMEGDFYFRPPPAATPSPTPSADGDTAETLFWKSILESRDPEDFKAYLAQFPKGIYAALANNRLRQLAPAPTPSPEATRKVAADPPANDDDLRRRIVAAMPEVEDRETIARLYLAEKTHRALFLAPDRKHTFRVGNFGYARIADEAGAERCQLHYSGPCSPVVIDNDLADPAAPPRNMPRVGYAGPFDPQQIPGLSLPRRGSDDVKGYAAAKGSKAIALHSWGHLFTATGAPDSVTAQQRALDACDDDPDRKGKDGPCFLYAIDDKVVLPERRDDPTDAVDRYLRIEQALANTTTAEMRANSLPNYRRQKEPKALTLNTRNGKLYWAYGYYAESRETVENLALEGCQQTWGEPCVLVATGTVLHAPDPAKAPLRDMPRLHYSGPFLPTNVPFVMADRATDLSDYSSLPDFKAIALRAVSTRYSIVSGAASAAEAERQALEKCKTADPTVKSPCFVYASGGQVVLPEGRTEPKR